MTKNTNFPPITCPECKKSKGLIIEQPDYRIKAPHISIQCRCIDCGIEFEAGANISVVSYSNVENKP